MAKNEKSPRKQGSKIKSMCIECKKPKPALLHRNRCHRCCQKIFKELGETFSRKKEISRRGLRKKGHRFENEIAEVMREFFPDARRQLEYNEQDCNGVDLQHTGRYKIQCKRTGHYVTLAAINEIECDPDLCGDVPILIAKADNAPTLAAMPLDHFLELIRDSRAFKSLRLNNAKQPKGH